MKRHISVVLLGTMVIGSLLCRPVLVGNDSGGGIAQIFAALYPERVRSLTLSDCDTHDNWPPEAFKPFLAMAAAGGLRGTLDAMSSDKSVYRSPQALGPAYEHPEQ